MATVKVVKESDNNSETQVTQENAIIQTKHYKFNITEDDIQPPMPPLKYAAPAMRTEALIKAESDSIINLVTSNIKELNESFSKKIEEIENLVKNLQESEISLLKNAQVNAPQNSSLELQPNSSQLESKHDLEMPGEETIIEGGEISYNVNLQEAEDFLNVLSTLIESTIKEQIPIIQKELADDIRKRLLERREEIFAKTYQAFIKGSLMSKKKEKRKRTKENIKEQPKREEKKPIPVPKFINEKQYFYLENGKVLKSILSLFRELIPMEEQLFARHSNSAKNDFANWIENIFMEKELGIELRKANSKAETVKILGNWLKDAHMI